MNKRRTGLRTLALTAAAMFFAAAAQAQAPSGAPGKPEQQHVTLGNHARDIDLPAALRGGKGRLLRGRRAEGRSAELQGRLGSRARHAGQGRRCRRRGARQRDCRAAGRSGRQGFLRRLQPGAVRMVCFALDQDGGGSQGQGNRHHPFRIVHGCADAHGAQSRRRRSEGSQHHAGRRFARAAGGDGGGDR